MIESRKLEETIQAILSQRRRITENGEVQDRYPRSVSYFNFSCVEMKRIGYSLRDYRAFNDLRNLLATELSGDSINEIYVADFIWMLHDNLRYNIYSCFLFVEVVIEQWSTELQHLG